MARASPRSRRRRTLCRQLVIANVSEVSAGTLVFLSPLGRFEVRYLGESMPSPSRSSCGTSNTPQKDHCVTAAKPLRHVSSKVMICSPKRILCACRRPHAHRPQASTAYSVQAIASKRRPSERRWIQSPPAHPSRGVAPPIVWCASCGIVTLRRQPKTANGATFGSLEGDTGAVQVICQKSNRERQRWALLAV